MKKLLLLIASGSIALSVSAQQAANSSLTPKDLPFNRAQFEKYKSERFGMNNNAAHKTTSMSRWYNYADYLTQHEAALSGTTDYSFPYLWGNNNVLMTFSGPTFDTNNLVSYGIVIDPSYGVGTPCAGFNDDNIYMGAMKITPTDAFTVDSIAFDGAYVVNPARTSIDTLRLSFVYGTGAASADVYTQNTTITSGSVLTNYGAVGSILNNQRMHFDAGHLTATGSTLHTYDIILNNAVTPPTYAADTINGLYFKTIPVGISVPAGSLLGATVSFISGATVPMWDTVFFGSPTTPPVKYNMFRPAVNHRGSTTASFPTYLAADKNNGVFVDKLTTTFYVPHWFWSAGTSAADVQYPEILFRLTCATCGAITTCPTGVENVTTELTANASPNPSYGELSIPFTASGSANVTVTLTNVLGQVVATQNMGKVTSGKAVFNTTSLPAGVYVYNVVCDGKQSTGRVVVGH